MDDENYIAKLATFLRTPAIVAVLMLSLALLSVPSMAQQTVEQWKKFEVSYVNSSWSGNPYDIILTAEFARSGSSNTKTQFGFYAGNDTWKIYFMPDEVGEWSFSTSSADSDLNGRTGAFTATAATISGQIKPINKRWRLSSGESIAPTILAVGPYVRSNSINDTQGLIDWASDVAGATYLGTTLLNFSGDDPYTVNQEDRMYVDGSGEGNEFYLPAWERTNAFYDAARDANMGHYILIYSDDASNPSIHGIPEGSGGTISSQELRLFRYLVARLAPYPKVIWDSGIDIGENRSNTWINNFVAWFHANDPWGHPISSRNGGGSGGIHPAMADYFSDGDRTLPNRTSLILSVEQRNVASGLTDRYREDYASPFDGGRDKIREAAWQTALTYGTLVYFGGSDAGGYLVANYASDFKAAPDLGVLREFLEAQVVNYDALVPQDNKVVSGDAWLVTDNVNEVVVYSGSGSSFTLNLALGDEVYTGTWFDPVSGATQTAPSASGSNDIQYTKPGNNAGGENEWALHLVRDQGAVKAQRINDLGATTD